MTEIRFYTTASMTNNESSFKMILCEITLRRIFNTYDKREDYIYR